MQKTFKKKKNSSVSNFVKTFKYLCNICLPISKIRVAVIPAFYLRSSNLKNKVDSWQPLHVLERKHKRSCASHVSMVSLQHFFVRQSWKETQKGKSSLYNNSILNLLNKKRKMTLPSIRFVAKKKRKRWRSPFGFRGRWSGYCLVCKSISSCTHVSTHTFHNPQMGFSAQSSPG